MATKYGGYMGKILDVDLTTGAVGTYEVSDHDRERFLGGKSLAAKILWDELSPGIDPLGPENILVFMTGPLTGTGAPCSARFDLSTKNVLTGGIASANSGGDLGIKLKKAGWDGLIVRGVAKTPSRLDISDDEVTIGDATDLWGKKNAEEAQEGVDRKTATAAIGPAGENLVRFASVMVGERAFGRCGVGAVMGSKRLKLITVKGTKKIPVHDRAPMMEAVKGWTKILREHEVTGERLPALGTASLVEACSATNTLPTHNFRQGHFDGAPTISGEYMAKHELVKNTGCTACPIRCGRVVRHEGKEIKGPEFETIGMFGSAIGNADLKKIIEWNYLCDLYGMDTITAGSTIACAMELADEGLLKDSGLAFGETGGVSELLRQIAHREGLGDELAEGSMRLAKKYRGARFAMHAKGLEMAAYEPRGAVGHGLGYATANRGGCHIGGGYLVFLEALGSVTMDPHATRGKPELAVMQQNLMEAISACGTCIFTSYAVLPSIPPKYYNPHGLTGAIADKILQSTHWLLGGQGRMKPGMTPFHPPFLPHTKVLSHLTGMNLHMGYFTAVGERGYTMERLFNLREGILREADTLPPRMTDELQDPGNPRSRVPLEKLLPRYYHVRDWDGDGVPTVRLLEKLDMHFAIPEVESVRHDPNSRRLQLRKAREGEQALLRKALRANRRASTTV